MTAPLAEAARPILKTFSEVAGEFFAKRGVPLGDIPHYVRLAAEKEGEATLAQAPRNAKAALGRLGALGPQTFKDTPFDAANRLGLSIDLNGGFYHVKRDGKRLGSFVSMDEAHQFSQRAGKAPNIELTPSPLPTAGMGGGFSHGGGQPPLVGEVVGGWQREPPKSGQSEGRLARIFDALNIFLAIGTSMEPLSRSLERSGFGKAYTGIYRTSQASLDLARAAVNKQKRPTLGMKTFNEAMDQSDRLRLGFGMKENANATRLWEHASRQEIRDGLINGRPMTPESIAFGDAILAADKAPELPRLFRKAKELNKIRRTAEYRRVRKQDKNLAEGFAWTQLELDGDEINLVTQISDLIKRDPEKVKINLVEAMSYARAPDLNKDQYAQFIGASAKEVEVAGFNKKVMDELKSDVGYDVDSQYRGFWPLVRELAREGAAPLDLKLHMPKGIDWTVNSFLHGEQELWRMNPTVNVAKYIRGAYMEKFFSPITKGIEQELSSMAKFDERAARIMGEYWREVRGMPHRSFDTFDQVVSSTLKILTGGKISKGTTRELVDTLSGLGYGALIPFRLGLLLRNFAAVMMILPRVGLESWVAGMERGLTKEGYQRAVKAGAVQEGVLPFHQATGIFERNGIYLGNRKVWNELGTRLTTISKAGFKWYQIPDDLGRAIASEAQRHRINTALSKYGQAALGDTQSEAYRLFEKEAGVLSFDPLDVDHFRLLWRQGNREEASQHLQKLLARETFFRYGGANHAPGWGSVAGRLLGQFGSWPVQYKDYILQGLSRGTDADRRRFAAWTVATNGALIYGAGALGLNSQGWAPAMSLMYGGGPWTGTLVDVYQSLDGSPAEKSMARAHLGELIPMINPFTGEFDPTRVRSIVVPYSGAVQDIINVGKEKSAYDAFTRSVGFPPLPEEKEEE